MDKTMLYVLRGLPGSGKSTEAARIAKATGAVVCSTDDYFLVRGVYRFDRAKLGEYHAKNFERVVNFLRSGVSVVLDNTNVRRWEYKRYVDAAVELGCGVNIRVIGSPKDPSTWPVCASRTLHGVPEDAIRRMGERFQL